MFMITLLCCCCLLFIRFELFCFIFVFPHSPSLTACCPFRAPSHPPQQGQTAQCPRLLVRVRWSRDLEANLRSEASVGRLLRKSWLVPTIAMTKVLFAYDFGTNYLVFVINIQYSSVGIFLVYTWIKGNGAKNVRIEFIILNFIPEMFCAQFVF